MKAQRNEFKNEKVSKKDLDKVMAGISKKDEEEEDETSEDEE